MNVYEKMQANNLIDNITDLKSDFFNAADARELISLIPVTPRQLITFKLEFKDKSKNSGKIEGYSPGIGNITIPDDKKGKSTVITNEKFERIGIFKVNHEPGVMEISQLWAETYNDDSSRSCLLTYDKKSKEPQKLKTMAWKSFSFADRIYRFGTWQTWKTPSLEP